ncbi:MAG: VOC family protein [Halobacteriaceae archaeon]
MISHIDHLGILVDDIDRNVGIYEAMGLEVGAIETVPDFDVRIAFIRVGETLVELVEPLDNDLPENTAELDHVAFAVDDIAAALEDLAAQGIPLADEEPRPGAGDSDVAFLEAAAGNGVVFELVERHSPVDL